MRASELLRRASCGIGPVALLATLGSGIQAQDSPKGSIGLPQEATALEGLPRIRVDTTPDSATRRELDPAEAARSRLAIRIADGRFYWSSRDDRPLARSTAGEFVYLSTTEPGKYVRIRRVNDRLTYVEHVDTEFGSVTYWGELRVVLGK